MNEIREVRERSGVSRRELCESIDLPYRTLEDWECERRTPPKWAENLFDTEKEAVEKAETILAHLTENEKKDRDGFYVGFGVLDEDGEVDFDNLDVIKVYI